MTIRVLKYLVLLAFALLIAAISSFWFSDPSFREKDVVLELEGPTQVSSGEEVAYKFKYKNQTRSVLRNLDFTFSYPDGATVLIEGQAKENYTEDFEIEKLAPGEKGEKEFKVFLIGEKGNIKIAKINVLFNADSLTSSFEKSTSLSTTIVSTPITLTLVALPNIISGDATDYILDYRNESSEDASDLIIEFDYPDGFSYRSFSPNPESGNNIWLIKSLRKGSGGRISVGGILNGQEGDHKIVSAKLKRKIGGEYVDYQKASADTVISNPLLGLEVFVNNSSDYSASLGEKLSYSIKYKNNSNENLSNLNLVVKLEGDMFDFSGLDTQGGLFDDSSKTIIWNSSVTPVFANLSPNTNGQVNFNINLKPFFSSSVPGASQDKFVKVSIKLGTLNVPSGIDGNEISISASAIARIGIQPIFNQFTEYNKEDKSFTVYWQLTNPGNEAENVKVTTKLPSGIEWVNISKATEVQVAPAFNSSSSEVSWDLGKLPSGTGIFTPKYEASFVVKTKEPLGNDPVLILESSQFVARDSFTKQDIIINKSSLNSN